MIRGERGCGDQARGSRKGFKFPLEVAPEPVGREQRGKGVTECHSNPFRASRGRGGGAVVAEEERAGREESRVKLSSSPFLVLRKAGSSVPVTSPFPSLIQRQAAPQPAPGHPPTGTHRLQLESEGFQDPTQHSAYLTSKSRNQCLILQLGFLCINPLQSSYLGSS